MESAEKCLQRLMTPTKACILGGSCCMDVSKKTPTRKTGGVFL